MLRILQHEMFFVSSERKLLAFYNLTQPILRRIRGIRHVVVGRAARKGVDGEIYFSGGLSQQPSFQGFRQTFHIGAVETYA